jgi:hypothetical protein
MAIYHNPHKNPRGVNAVDGTVVVIPPGESREATLSDDEEKAVLGLGFVERAGDSDKSDDADIELLREQAKDLGIKVDGRWSSQRIEQEIDDALQSTDPAAGN